MNRPPVPQGGPRLSVVIVSYECAGHLTRCLASLERDWDPGWLEVLVVDNGSTDGTVAMVRERFAWVEVIDAGENLGFARASNRAARQAKGTHLLFLNPDTIVPPGALAAAVAALEERPGVGMLGCKLVQADGTLDHACKRGFPTPLSSLAYFTGVHRLRPASPRLNGYTAAHLGPDETGTVDAVNGAFMLVRREAVDAVGLMDEGFPLYMEDLDWCYRFWQAGWPVLYWPQVTVTHLKGGSSGRHRSWRTNVWFHQGMWRFYRKHYAATRPAPVTAAVGAAILVKFAVSATRSAVVRALR